MLTSQTHNNKKFKNLTSENQNLSNKDFENCIFEKCNFTEANFENGNFIDCRFIKCNLSLTNFRQCKLQNIDFVDSKLTGIKFREINKRFGTTFIVVTHDRTVAAKTDRIIEIRDGRIVQDVRK